jgi:hypothetical protein
MAAAPRGILVTPQRRTPNSGVLLAISSEAREEAFMSIIDDAILHVFDK